MYLKTYLANIELSHTELENIQSESKIRLGTATIYNEVRSPG